jgi:hypothetical protein
VNLTSLLLFTCLCTQCSLISRTAESHRIDLDSFLQPSKFFGEKCLNFLHTQDYGRLNIIPSNRGAQIAGPKSPGRLILYRGT